MSMNREDRKNVASVIESNSQWVTLQQLADRGTTQVRVLSRKKALGMMQAVVDDAIRQEVGKVTDADRRRITAKANEQYRHVSRIQAQSEAVIQHQKELLARQQLHIQQLEKAQDQHNEQIDANRQPSEQWEATSRLQASALDEAQKRLYESTQRQQKMERALARVGRRLAGAQDTIRNYDREVERLAKQVTQDSTLIEKLRFQLNGREHELGRVKGLMEALDQQLVQVRTQNLIEPDHVQSFRSELVEMKRFLKSMKVQNGQMLRSDVEAMLEKITEKETVATTQLENRFDSKLNETLKKVDQTLRAVTIRTVDRPVEADSVSLSNIFDDEMAMESNFKSLDIQATTTKKSISESLDRLKRLRNQAAQAMKQDSEHPSEE